MYLGFRREVMRYIGVLAMLNKIKDAVDLDMRVGSKNHYRGRAQTAMGGGQRWRPNALRCLDARYSQTWCTSFPGGGQTRSMNTHVQRTHTYASGVSGYRRGLPVGHDRAVVAFERVVHDARRTVEYALLVRSGVEDVVIHEGLGLVTV